jgi:hypothetical protein
VTGAAYLDEVYPQNLKKSPALLKSAEEIHTFNEIQKAASKKPYRSRNNVSPPALP